MEIISAHREHGPGHAWLIMDAQATPGTSVTIERDTDKDRYLGVNGWQSVPQDLPVKAIEGARMLLGPTIVDHLSDGDLVKITISGSGLSEENFWPDVPISGRTSSAFGIVSPKPAPELHRGMDAGKFGPAVAAEQEDPFAGLEEEGSQSDQELDDLMQWSKDDIVFAEGPQPATRSNRLATVGLIVLALLIFAGGLSWYFRGYLRLAMFELAMLLRHELSLPSLPSMPELPNVSSLLGSDPVEQQEQSATPSPGTIIFSQPVPLMSTSPWNCGIFRSQISRSVSGDFTRSDLSGAIFGAIFGAKIFHEFIDGPNFRV